MYTLEWKLLTTEERQSALSRPNLIKSQDQEKTVFSIISSVKHGGDSSLLDLTLSLDKAHRRTVKVTRDEIDKAYAFVSDNQLEAIKRAASQITTFHTRQVPEPIQIETTPGVMCWKRALPIERVGLYIPGGTAPLVSTVLMLAIPAKIAGCEMRVLCTPPQRDGSVNPHILVAADLCGVSSIFAVGGAQAIAAMAYGTESIPKVDKIFGPGNSWVTAAKIAVSLDPGGAALDMPAGPSEVLVVADDTSDADSAAADLLSQAEHGIDSQVILVSLSKKKAEDILSAINDQLTRLTRKSIASKALDQSKIIIVDGDLEALEIINSYAPEHLILLHADAKQFSNRVRNAGSIFIGPWTPESVGDYASGTNHVLPTNGFCRTFSGLGTESFMKFITYQELTADGLRNLGPTVETLAAIEGLDAHKYAVSQRLSKLQSRSIK
jgi:histidinol dehydrogenase